MRKLMLMMMATTALLVQAGNLDDVFNQYIAMQEALAGDNAEAAHTAAAKLAKVSEKVNAADLTGEIKKAWEKHGPVLKQSVTAAATGEINDTRTHFDTISKAAIALADYVHPKGLGVYRCPMAFNNKGANWLQKKGDVANPYYGASMLRCGYEIKPKQGKDGTHSHGGKSHKH